MPSDPPAAPIPITVFTGFLGAGKTSIILSLLPQLPKDYRAVLLKNEFGDVEVDSQLAKQSSLTAVKNYHPDRIIIECSGSAFPATLAFQIRELERETNRALALDAIVTVIDAENFSGYEDTSTTARMQAQYTDVIVLNKSEHVSERALDDVVEHLNTLNDLTPKIKCNGRAGVDPSLIFGLDSKLFLEDTEDHPLSTGTHHDEVETVTLWRGVQPPTSADGHAHVHTDGCRHGADGDTHIHAGENGGAPVEAAVLEAALTSLSKETVYRVKGFVRLPSGLIILNWAFGRYELHPFTGTFEGEQGDIIKLTVMGERGEVRRAARKLGERLDAELRV
ncbi:hypothetical protein EWM64_g9047 [Hericium alpestre]|uniref:CobW/HypB/UreG nucleotide-binding domain-containing protein n=1 Tax=Hericium alpestre TaxID=135208 RepID=A0A4Y9ZK50_9AGAM|nr:hypothetical protein EWM64_g9047 [Hericium alpestre]